MLIIIIVTTVFGENYKYDIYEILIRDICVLIFNWHNVFLSSNPLFHIDVK